MRTSAKEQDPSPEQRRVPLFVKAGFQDTETGIGNEADARGAGLPAAATTATAAAATAAAAEAATTATAAAAVFAGTSFVDGEITTIDVLAVEAGDGRASVLIVAKLDETEPTGPAGVAVHDQRGGRDIAELGEEFAELGL